MKLSSINDYKRPKKTKLDKISDDPEEISKKLEGYIQIHPDNFKDIECGIWIKYITHEKKYRSGGILKLNKAPDYFIVENPYNKISWSVGCEKNFIFIKENDTSNETNLTKKRLFELYKAGLIHIDIEPEGSYEDK